MRIDPKFAVAITVSVLSVIIAIFVNFVRDRHRREENAPQAALQEKHQRMVEMESHFQARMQEATVDSEIATARGTLLELENDSLYHSSWQKYGPWIFTLQLTTPQYLPWLSDANLVNNHVPSFEESGSSEMLWLITGDGSRAAHRNEFDNLRFILDKLKAIVAKRHEVSLERFLYGRYVGVG